MKPRTPPRSQPRNQRLSSTRQRKQQHLLDVKVRSRAANRQRNRRLLTLISALLLICGAAGGSWYGARILLRKYLWQNPEYNLSEIDIHTDGSLSREQVLGATQIHEGVNIYTIHLSAARKALMALPQVERYWEQEQPLEEGAGSASAGNWQYRQMLVQEQASKRELSRGPLQVCVGWSEHSEDAEITQDKSLGGQRR